MTRPKWSDGVVKIALKARTLRGGLFAVHRTPDYSDSWTVTHVPSGYAAAHYLRSEEAAKRCAEALTVLPIDWATYQPTSTAARALPKDVRAEVRRIMAEARASE